MSKYHILEGGSTRNPRTRYFQVFIGGKTVGDPYPTREQAQAHIERLEKREAEAERQHDDGLER
ncbi:hypothetical protein [Pseudomonas corrugata]